MALYSSPDSQAEPTMISLRYFCSTARGMLNSFSRSSSQSWVRILNSIVREALVASVTWGWPFTRCQASQLSTVPKQYFPLSASAWRPQWSRIQRSLVAAKYASGVRPVFSRIMPA